jgi:hypothetical protein
LERLIEPFLTAQPGRIGWTYSDLDRVDEDGKIVTRGLLSGLTTTHPKTSLATCLAEDMVILPSASLISRPAFEAVGGFDEALSGYEDDDLFLRMFRIGYENIYLDAPLSRWRMWFESASYSPRMNRSRRIYAEKLIGLYPDNKRKDQYYTRDLIAPRFLKQFYGAYRRAVLFGPPAEARTGLNNLWFISRHMRPLARLSLWIILPWLSVPGMMKLALALRGFLPRGLKGRIMSVMR